MMSDMEFVMGWHKGFRPFFMKQVMDIAIGCSAPEKPRKKSKIIVQVVCNVNKHTGDNKK